MADNRLYVIDAATEKETALDFSFLRERGIALLQELCGETWTDYNLHDPGITILEALCFAITDLAYRTEFPITDILSDETGNIHLPENSFFAKDKILSTGPVTVNDFRKTILDEMDELYNVWLEPVRSAYTHESLRGLYRLVVQVKKEIATFLKEEASFEQMVKQNVLHYFVSKRNLGEDAVQDVMVLKPVAIQVEAEVAINNEILPEAILASIYQQIEFAINPPARHYTESEMLEKGYKIEEIYEGPALKKGFIPTGETVQRKKEIDPAELIKAITGVDGVIYVKNLFIKASGVTTGKAPYILDDGTFAFFDDSSDASAIKLYKDKYEVIIREVVFRDISIQVQETAKRSNVSSQNRLPLPRIAKGVYRNLNYYHSIQQLFPVIYGIAEEGLPANASKERKAQAKQLKAYLLFFEQVLAGYLAQLANTRRLFSATNGHEEIQTYYQQPLYNVPGIKELLKAFTVGNDQSESSWEEFVKDKNNPYRQALKKASETPEEYRQRKNRLLDHLLARFNEQPISYPVTLYNTVYKKTVQETKAGDVIEWKEGILQHLAITGNERNKGFNYLQQEGGNESGFGKKIARLLYIPNYLSKSLTAALRPEKIKITRVKPGGRPIATQQAPAEEKKYRKEELGILNDEQMRQMLFTHQPERKKEEELGKAHHIPGQKISFFRYGIDTGNYKIGPDITKGEGHLLLYKEPYEQNWQIISRHQDEAAAIRALKELVTWLEKISIASEGFYIIEHILLRPLLNTTSFGFRFRTAADEILLQHDRWTTFEERERVLDEIIKAAGDDTSDATGKDFRIWADLCRVQLKKNKPYNLLLNPALFSGAELTEATDEFKNSLHHIRQFRKNKLRFYPGFEMLVKGSGGKSYIGKIFQFHLNNSITCLACTFPGS